MKALAVEFLDDVRSAQIPEQYRFVETEILADRLGIDQQGMRQRITRFRNIVEQRFLEALDVQLMDGDVLQNEPGRGYRLNPYLLLVQPSQVRNLTNLQKMSRL